MAKKTGKTPSHVKDQKQETQNLGLMLVFTHPMPDIAPLQESLGKIQDRNIGSFRIISVLNASSAGIRDTLLANPVYARISHTEIVTDTADPWQMMCAGLKALQLPIAAVLFPGFLARPIQLNELASFKPESSSREAIIYLPVFSDSSYIAADMHAELPLMVLPKNFGQYLCQTLAGEPFSGKSLWKQCQRLDKTMAGVRFNQPDPFAFSGEKKKATTGLPDSFRSSYRWFVSLPLRERKQPVQQYLPYGEHSIFRFVFLMLALVMLLAFPLLSLQSGISGDEEVNYIHAGYVYNYYKTMGKDTTCLNTPATRLQYYGQSFDNFTYLFNKTFGIQHVYEWRHVFNSLAGWLAVLFGGLTAALLAGWRAGIITMLLMFFSPVFLGHSFNNPKDIPFALGYIWSIYGIMLFLKNYPAVKFRHALLLILGIAYTLSIRAGGLLQIVYFAFFTGLWFLITSKGKQFFSAENMGRMKNLILWVLGISLAGYVLGILWWPYALQNPVKNVLESLRLMTNFDASLRQVFEGKYVWSDNLPWYYIPKYIFITVPLVVIAGLLVFTARMPMAFRKYNKLFLILILFAWIFPVAYVINKASNVYGSWRHLLFVFPPLAITASVGWNTLFVSFRKKYAAMAVALIMAVLLALPARHIIANHPLEYVYYNELVGGVKGAYGNYETDYYYHSIRPGSMWLKNQLTREMKDGDTVIVVSNFLPSLKYYFADMKGRVKTVYTRYYEKGEVDWDYGIFACSYMNPDQLKHGYFPPRHTIHTVTVDGVPVCAVVKRTSKADYEGTRLLESDRHDEALKYLKEALQDNPDNEVALMNIARCYIEMQQPDSSLPYISHLLKVYPDYDKALNMLGVAYLTRRELPHALSVFERTIKVNPKFVTAYFNIGLTYGRMNNLKMAEKYFQKTIEVNQNYKPAYFALADLWQQTGHTAEAQQLLEYARSLP